MFFIFPSFFPFFFFFFPFPSIFLFSPFLKNVVFFLTSEWTMSVGAGWERSPNGAAKERRAVVPTNGLGRRKVWMVWFGGG